MTVNQISKNAKQNDLLMPLRQTALVFFFIIGATHILTGLMSSQEIFLPLSNHINRILDIPFAIIATIYGLSNFHISSDNPRKNTYLLIMSAICLLVLGILVYINLFIPDRIITDGLNNEISNGISAGISDSLFN